MKILVLASQKGGAGKTTLAAHLAIEAERVGAGPVVLIDTDPQGSLAAWWNSRQAETPALAGAKLTDLPAKLDALAAAGFKLAVIDTPPAITDAIRDVVKLADLVLIPTRPSPHDLRAVGSTVDIAQETGRAFAFAVTQAKPTARLTVQAVAALSAHGAVAPAIMHDRVDYAASMVDGRSVQEVDAKSRSAQEIAGLFAFVQERMNGKTKDRKKEVV
jgi:chromosome partitioning protein